LTAQEKYLYHQIHPAKLATDWGTGFVALYLLWRHELIAALIVMFVPAMVASFLIVRYVSLASYKQSAFGRYVKRYMTRAMEAIRIAGNVSMMIGAWYHLLWLPVAGLLVILFGWFRGLVLPNSV